MKLDVTFSEPKEMNAGFGEIQVIGGGGGVTEEQLAETLEEAKAYTDEAIANIDDGGVTEERVNELIDEWVTPQGYLSLEDFYELFYFELDYAINTTSDEGGVRDIITENVIASLPIYDGEVV